MTNRDISELVLLAAIWGASFLFMRTATPEFGAIPLVLVRTLVAALSLLPLLIFKKQLLAVIQHWFPIMVVGLVNTAIPFVLFSYATAELGAGFGAVLNATAPMFGAMVAVVWLKDKLHISAVLGLVVGFGGVLVLSAMGKGLSTRSELLPVFAALGATFAYGIAACYTRRYLSGVQVLAIATGSQIFATLALIPLAVVTWPDAMPSLQAWWQTIALGIVCTGLAYLLYFRLIANVGASRAITVAYLVPVFGVVWGIVFLQEGITSGLLIGGAMILLGVSLTTGIVKLRR